MNKLRRTKLKTWKSKAECLKDELDAILSEEQEAFDNMPEGLQCSTRGEESEEAIGQMEDAISSLEDAIDNISEIV